MSNTISYAIPVCNEHKEIRVLLEQLLDSIRDNDEVVVQMDSEHVTDEVRRVIGEFEGKFFVRGKQFKSLEFALNMDFAAFKNHLKSQCSCDYIFQIDADEYLGKYLLRFLPDVLSANPDVDAFITTRINGVRGITDEYIQLRNWMVTEMAVKSLGDCDYKAVNFPDSQIRIMKNVPYIHWVNKVHETLVGFRTYVNLKHGTENHDPSYIESWSLIHIKDFERQKKQNEFYDEF